MTPLVRTRALAALSMVWPGVASAHIAEGVSPTLRWVFEPWVVLLLAASLVAYVEGLHRIRSKGAWRSIGPWKATAFGLGWLSLTAALVTPIDPLGAWLFSAHMLQHELMMVLAAPLMVIGRPLVVWLWALPAASRPSVGGAFRHPLWRVPWRFFSAPLPAFVQHALVLWLWHVPSLFDAALDSEWVHTLQHLSFLFSALLFWWTVLRPADGRSGPERQGTALITLLLTMMHSGALGALLTLSTSPWYDRYLTAAPAFGFDALEDQQLGGLIMWVPSALSYLLAALVIAASWLTPAGDRGADARAARRTG